MSTSRGKRLPLRLDGNGSATVNVTGDGTAFQPSSPEFVLLNSQFADARVLNAQLRSRLADAATAVDLGAHDDDADDDDADDDSVSEAGDQLDSDSTGDAIPHRPAPLPLNSRTPTPPTGCASIPAVPLPIRDRDPSLSSSAPLRNEPIPFNAASTPNTFASATTTDVSTSTSSPATKAGRLLIVSNRLPVSMSVKTVSNPRSSSSSSSTTTMREISFSPSSGGLVSALRGCEMEMLWFGWPGCEVENSSEREIVRSKLSSQGCVPVFLPSELIDLYYNGFCNNILWPLFHYIPLPIESLTSGDQQFSSYEKCNQLFAKTILEVYEDGDVVWVHDYHLMLLPMILRKMKSDMKVGFFLHTPFPSSEIYRGLPSRKELLLGVLCANLIGFHTHDYGRHFQSACTRILGANCSGDRIKFKGQIAEVGTFPIGIDPQKFIDTLKTGPVQSLKRELKQKFNGKKVILGIDRLDYIKGIGQKLYGLERFFEKHPEWIGRVVLVQIAVPSRTDVPEYQRLRSSTHELVGRLNGRFGSLDSVPVHYLDQSIPFDMMCALYRISNSMIITSVRDGMNLVAYEYIACQGQEDEPDGDGCLILSEFAGAAQSLGAGAIQVNPWNINETAEAIYQALTMNSKERTERMRYLLNHVMTHTSRAWARSFVSTLNSLPQLQSAVDLSDDGITPRASSIIPLDIDTVMGTFAQSKHRVIITSLAAIVAKARKASRFAAGLKPDVSTELEGLEQCLEEGLDEVGLHFQRDPDLETMKMVVRSLSVDPNTTFIILTSRSRQWCDELFGDIPEIWLCAENGLYVRRGTNPNINLNQSNPIPSFDSNSMNAESSVAGPAPAPSAPISNSLLNLNSDFNPNSSSSPTWQCMYDDVPLDWKDGVRKIFDYFAHRTPNSYILEESSHMSWHYHDADPTHAKQQANDLISHLTGGPLSNTSTELVDSHQMVQVTPVGVTPARAVKWILNHLHHRRNKLLKAESAAFEGQQAETPPASGYGSVGTDEDDKNSSGKSKSEEIDDDKSNYVALGASVSRRKSFSTLTSFITSTDAKHRTPVDFVLCIGKFLERDVDLFTVLNGWSDQHQISLSAFPSTASTPTAGSRRMSSIATTPASSNAPSLASGVSSGSGHGPSSRTFIFPPPFQSEAASRSSSGASDPVSDIGSSHLTNIFSPSPQSFGSTMGERVLSRSNMNPNDLFGPPLRSSTGSSSSSMPPHLLSQGRYGLPHLSLDSLSVSTAATLPSPSPFGLNDSNPAVSPPTACGTPSQSTHPNNNTSGCISGSSSSSASAPLIFTVSIGGGPSKARYFLDDSEAAYALILRLGAAIQEKRMESTKLQQDVSESMETGKEKDREKEMAKDTDKADEISSGFERLEKRGSEKSSKLQM